MSNTSNTNYDENNIRESLEILWKKYFVELLVFLLGIVERGNGEKSIAEQLYVCKSHIIKEFTMKFKQNYNYTDSNLKNIINDFCLEKIDDLISYHDNL